MFSVTNKMEPEIYEFRSCIAQYKDGRYTESVECEMCFTNIFQIHDTIVGAHNFLRSKYATEVIKSRTGILMRVPLRRPFSMDYICNLPYDVELEMENIMYIEKDKTKTIVDYYIRRIPSPVTPIKQELLRFKPSTCLF